MSEIVITVTIDTGKLTDTDKYVIDHAVAILTGRDAITVSKNV